MLSLDVRRAELTGLIPREEDDAPCFFCIALEHIARPPRFFRRSNSRLAGRRRTSSYVPTTRPTHILSSYFVRLPMFYYEFLLLKEPLDSRNTSFGLKRFATYLIRFL